MSTEEAVVLAIGELEAAHMLVERARHRLLNEKAKLAFLHVGVEAAGAALWSALGRIRETRDQNLLR